MSALAFVDLETTGATAGSDRITEIGIVEVDADGSVREWQQLVNPQTRIPPFIEQLTGISNAMVAAAPTFAEVAEATLARLRGRLFIAHNARFDYAFLKNEFARLGIAFRADVLCTVKLSRALFPEHHRHNLDSLVERHGLSASARHRALADAQLIHQFWQRVQAGCPAAQLAAAIAKQVARPSLPPQLDPANLDALPDTPGVYLFYGENDLPIYVGKAKDIRQRVLGHFAADLRAPREMALAQQVRRIDWRETAGEIGALLAEAALVKTLQPVSNRQLRRNDEVCTWQLDEDAEGWLRPRLTVVDALDLGPATACYGLYKTAREATRQLRTLAESAQLCECVLGLAPAKPGKPCFAFQLKRCQGACVGREPAARHNTRLIAALAGSKLTTWPFAGPAVLREGDEGHLVAGWRYLGTVRRDEEIGELLAAPRPPFDRDIFRILSKHVARLQPLPGHFSPEKA